MSRCSKICNEIKQKIDSISGLDDDFIFNRLEILEWAVSATVAEINKYVDKDELNGTCFNKISKADKMFEELGYQSSITDNAVGFINEDGSEFILFLSDKRICIHKDNTEYPAMSIQELEAINQKVKELRMGIDFFDAIMFYFATGIEKIVTEQIEEHKKKYDVPPKFVKIPSALYYQISQMAKINEEKLDIFGLTVCPTPKIKNIEEIEVF